MSSRLFKGAIYALAHPTVLRPDDVEAYQQYALSVAIDPEVRSVGLRVQARDGILYYNMGGYGADAVEFQGGAWRRILSMSFL